MRTSDRTYYQQLSFSDPDRKNDIHNGASLYLSQEDKIKKLAELYLHFSDGFEFKEDWNSLDHHDDGFKVDYYDGREFFKKRHSSKWVTYLSGKYSLNKPITNTTDSGYSRIIGYIDLFVEINYSVNHKTEYKFFDDIYDDHYKKKKEDLKKITYDWATKSLEDCKEAEIKLKPKYKKLEKIELYKSEQKLYLGIEIKHGYTDVTEVLQQIQTYEEFAGSVKFILCTTHPISENYKKSLKDHNIRHIYVDKNDVVKFLESQKPVESERF